MGNFRIYRERIPPLSLCVCERESDKEVGAVVE